MALANEKSIVIHPQKGKKEKTIPEIGLLLVNPTEASSCQERLVTAGGKEQYLFNSKLVVNKARSFFCAGPAIGAPMAAMTMEKLIALGAKKIILFGWCGAIAKDLSVGDVLLPDAGLVGEGTSQYYSSNMTPAPSADFRDKVAKVLEQSDIAGKCGCVWSTDGIYREDRNMILRLHKKKGVTAVDMEFSALCSVSGFRGIDFSAVLIVSDELWGKSWRPGFSAKLFQSNKKSTLNALTDNIGGLLFS